MSWVRVWENPFHSKIFFLLFIVFYKTSVTILSKLYGAKIELSAFLTPLLFWLCNMLRCVAERRRYEKEIGFIHACGMFFCGCHAYRVSVQQNTLQGNDTKTGERFNNETAICTALGGNKFEDCIDLTKFLNSQLAGETKNRLQYVKLEYTEINNVNDIVKNLDVINSIVFEFNLLLGESNHSISQVGFAEKVPDKMDGFLGLMLRTPREFDRLGRLPAEDYETNLYSYEWRLKFSVKDKNSVYKGRFVTESIRSPLFYFGTSKDNDNIIISPSLTLWGDVPNHDNNTNWIHTRGLAGGGNLSLADNYFESTAGESKNITWTDFEKLVFSIDGGSRDNEEFHIYIEGEDSSGNKFEKELCERYILEYRRIQKIITVFVKDINTFKEEHTITDDSLRLSLRTGDNADFGILALKFE